MLAGVPPWRGKPLVEQCEHLLPFCCPSLHHNLIAAVAESRASGLSFSGRGR
ncbi:hypothetical protein DGI_3535 [Megalodesulfovibrio gigas DSM 1382 = ATCC 19364]|uniref:Uncharacterized protein n=1 Tax=Megalodesulfovibrio gigas (strain ATCC 19364 / DSM 1382 / NCIMB 9332 / VKM B-1759) TaxID=1121448 RepID=T2GG92_MEGG1|nr:hypothetical protein DGI_3535 [Megalodesulfovibrio gigas DSM 1382 = ATCC 19364]